MSEEWTIAEASRQIEAKRLAPAELVEHCLGRIRAYDDRVRAWVLVDEEGARRAARQAEEEIEGGRYRGPLHGIPLGIKDIIDVEGMPTEAGSPLRKGKVAERDAPLVAALRRAGAIVLGKTVTVEFACFDPSPTRNPWDPSLGHSPGGSSSGSAAAVAMGMCLGAIGTQTGGSLVRPASYCGIATCKPTFGRVDTEGVIPVSWHLDHAGPMARCVADLAVLLDHLPRSKHFAPPPPDRIREGRFGPTRPPRLGLVEELYTSQADEAVRDATQSGLAKLLAGEVGIEPVRLPDGFDAINDLHTRIMAVEAAWYHAQDFAAHRAHYGPLISGLLDQGLACSGVEYAAALAHQREFRSRVDSLFAHYDALIMPATDTTAPARLDTTGPKTFQAPWSYLGVPVVSLPCAMAFDGMPAAVQLVQRYHHDGNLLRVAQWCEERFAFDRRPPLLD
jgi:aspartyl-tRNA(Asn)/glutamyl-tRNA(Gln) amidotransferase subunit A